MNLSTCHKTKIPQKGKNAYVTGCHTFSYPLKPSQTRGQGSVPPNPQTERGSTPTNPQKPGRVPPLPIPKPRPTWATWAPPKSTTQTPCLFTPLVHTSCSHLILPRVHTPVTC